MPDNVSFQSTPATPASGTVVSTEEVTNLNGAAVSAQHVQRIAAAIRTADGSAVDLPGDSAQGLDVDVTRLPSLPAGNNNIGDVDIASLPNEGQQNMAGSISVAVASDQSAIPVTDNGGSLTVDGPLTDAQLRATAVPVSAVSLPLPTGASTSANQTTANTTLSAIQTAVETLDNAVSGSEMQVDVVGSLPVGDNNIGNVDVVSLPSIPAGSNNIGDVDVLSLPPIPAGTNNIGDVDVLTLPAIPTGDNPIGRVKLTDGVDVADVLDLTNANPLTVAVVDGAGNQITSFGGGTQYDEDTASSPADKLTMAGVVRKDSAASLVDTDGDRTQLQVDASGALRVTGGGGGTQYVEDAVSDANPTGSQLIARRRDSLSSETTADGDVTALNSTAKGELYVKHVDSIPVTGPLTDAELRASALTVFQSGVATASNQATGNTTLASIETQAVNQTNALQLIDDTVYTDGAGTPSKALGIAGSDGTNPQIIKTDTNGELQVDVLTSTPSSNQAANGTLTAAAQVVAINTNGVGTVALQITGTWTGSLQFQGTVDDTNYFTVRAYSISTLLTGTGTTANDQWFVPVAGLKKFRVRAASLSSGTANIFMEGSEGQSFIHLQGNLPVNIGQLGGSIPDVNSGNAGNGTQRVVLATDQPQLTNALKVDGSAVTQPVSGSVTANAGTNLNTSALNLEATQAAVKTAVELIDDAIYTDGTGTPSKAVGIAGTDGTNPQIVKTDANGELQVDVLSLPNEGQQTMANSISVAVASDQSAVPTAPVQTTASNLKSQIQGEAAHDATIAGNPVAVGGRSNNAVPAAVSADGEAVWAWLLRTGAQMVANAPHLGMLSDPFNLTFKCAQYTTTQTGAALWTPTAGKKIVIVSIQIQAGGTTAGTLQVWFGASADTTYTRGTDAAIFDGEFAPSSTLKPGFAQTGLWISPTADHILRITDSAAINPLTVTVWGYEI